MTEGYVHGTFTPDPELWGLIPSFLDAEDPRPAWEQINEHYQMGWRPLEGMRIEKIDEYNVVFRYEGDPKLPSISWMRFRDEMLYLNQHEFVALHNGDKWEASRLD